MLDLSREDAWLSRISSLFVLLLLLPLRGSLVVLNAYSLVHLSLRECVCLFPPTPADSKCMKSARPSLATSSYHFSFFFFTLSKVRCCANSASPFIFHAYSLVSPGRYVRVFLCWRWCKGLSFSHVWLTRRLAICVCVYVHSIFFSSQFIYRPISFSLCPPPILRLPLVVFGASMYIFVFSSFSLSLFLSPLSPLSLLLPPHALLWLGC